MHIFLLYKNYIYIYRYIYHTNIYTNKTNDTNNKQTKLYHRHRKTTTTTIKSMSNKKRKLNNILTSSYRNYIPLNPNNENRF